MATADTVAADIDDIAAAIARTVQRTVDEVHGDEATRADTVRRARASVLAFCEGLRSRKAPEAFEVHRLAREFARILARRGLPVSLLLRVHGLGLVALIEAFEQRLDRSLPKDTLLDATRALNDYAFAAHDVATEQLCAEFESERKEWSRGAPAVRRETVETLLADGDVDIDQASRALTYELRRWHVALVLWSSPDVPAEGLTSAFEVTANRVASELSGGRPLLVQRSPGAAWAWIGMDARVEAATLEGLSQICFGDSVWVAGGDCSQGVTGFRRSHFEAADAARVAKLSDRRKGSLTTYHSVELAAIMATDISRIRQFVHPQLGPLAGSGDEHGRLRVTLAVFLEEHGSRIGTARRLGVHPNTVANRVRACCELLRAGVREHRGPALEAEDVHDVDDAAGSTLHHRAHEPADHVPRAIEIKVDHGAPTVVADVQRVRHELATGVLLIR